MTNAAYEKITQLQYRCRNAEQRVKSLESGAEHRKLRLGMKRQRRYYEHLLKRKDREIARLSRQISSNREMWFQVYEDIQKEYEDRLSKAGRAIEKMEQRLREKDDKISEQKKKISDKTDEVVAERAKLNDEKEKNQKLQAQVDQNFQNSSTPSSQDAYRGKVPNNRPKTGRNEGAQPGHEGHGRKALPVTEEPVFIDAPDEIKNNPDFYEVSGPNATVHKQVIGIRFEVAVTDYWAKVYRNRKTGAKYHAPFPKGVQLEVNYDESVKALIFLLRNHLNVSIDKTCEFLEEMTDGLLRVSHGKVSGINEEFARKTKAEQDAIFASLAAGKVMYADMTCVRHNGKIKNVVICSDKLNIYYAFRDKKGHEGLKGTPVEYFLNTLVHDHDKTFYHYGSAHQDCNVHHTRYLRGAAETEKLLKWHSEMLELLLEMDVEREKQGRKLSLEQVDGFIRRYDAILDLAQKEYYDNPPSRYYRKGYNLYKEMREYKDSVLLFLTDQDVDFGNNEAERNARKVKRHTVMSGSFRGKTNQSGEDYCACMSVMQTDKRKGEKIYSKTREYFKRNAVIRPGRKAKKVLAAAPV